jgi:two-component system invasion response regulator UvrY
MDVADPRITVLIVDDQMPFRMAARSVVGATPGFEVVGEAKSGEEAIEQVEALHPQLVLMDINMDGISGIEATRHITRDHPEVRVILLSTYDEDDLPADARSCGALGYVHKEQFGPDVLIDMWPGQTNSDHG